MKSSFIWLINLYTGVLTVTVVLMTAFLIWSNIRNYNSEVLQAESTITTELSNSVSQNLQTTQQFANQLVANPETIENLNQYFSHSLMDYSDYATDRTISSGNYFFWPNESRLFLMMHPQVSKLKLQLANQKSVFIATPAQPGGQISTKRTNNEQDPFAITVPLINQYTLNTDGTLSITYKSQDLRKQLDQIKTVRPMQLFMQTTQNKSVFYYAGQSVSKQEQKRAKKAITRDQINQLKDYQVAQKSLPSGYTVMMVTNQHRVKQMIFKRILPLMMGGLLFLIILSSGLHFIFRRYQRQLKKIVDTVSHFGAGDLSTRVEVVSEQTDLKVLAEGINNMLEEIHEYVYTIYQLRISNQESNMRALQAQINPHFMSNTLEYIRMAALDANQPELAKVVYSFAALLRNNTDFSAQATLKEELSFVEKYIYLYQVRFPDRLAYQIKIAADVADIKLPKFSLQPIVENYFVHGVDFTRLNNALSIKVWQVGTQVNVVVINNGKTLTVNQVAKINREMRESNNVEKRTSIGLQNVYLRMKAYFGDSFDMTIGIENDGCVKVAMHFTNVEG